MRIGARSLGCHFFFQVASAYIGCPGVGQYIGIDDGVAAWCRRRKIGELVKQFGTEMDNASMGLTKNQVALGK